MPYLHLAAQVAVTTSVVDPRADFAVNALGTFNILDAVRRYSPEAVFIFASTNKVYGKIAGASCELRGNRYAYVDRPHGISETEPLDFLSPYGCSKGAADQYALDFARIYQIPATSFRQSCIYGPRQFGVEDQGWVAWFVIASMLGRDITIFGDGKQVRDVLHVDDLLRAYEAAIRAPDKVAGQAFNVGGGPRPHPLVARTDWDARGAARPQDSVALGRAGVRAISRSTSATSASCSKRSIGSRKFLPRRVSRSWWTGCSRIARRSRRPRAGAGQSSRHRIMFASSPAALPWRRSDHHQLLIQWPPNWSIGMIGSVMACAARNSSMALRCNSNRK